MFCHAGYTYAIICIQRRSYEPGGCDHRQVRTLASEPQTSTPESECAESVHFCRAADEKVRWLPLSELVHILLHSVYNSHGTTTEV